MTRKQPLMTLAGRSQTYADDFMPYAANIGPPNMRYHIWGRQIAAPIPASHQPSRFFFAAIMFLIVLMPDSKILSSCCRSKSSAESHLTGRCEKNPFESFWRGGALWRQVVILEKHTATLLSCLIRRGGAHVTHRSAPSEWHPLIEGYKCV